MKVKEIDRTVNTAWSPVEHHPILLAAGTAAQQLDASFNTSASLEIFALNLTDSSPDLEPKYSIPSQHRYHKVAWGGESPGVIVGGCDNGVIQMFNVSKLLLKEDALIANPERHTGAVKALDFNPFQKNLLATGATNSEIFIWDMNNTSTPMSPGAKSQPVEDVAWLAWNRQVQHILASTFPTRNVVWDLRKNEPIIKLTDATTRVRWKVVAWHPEVATQLCLASEEDSNPVVQLWDLRFATSPLKTFKGHTRGVLSLAWCNQDPDLLISSGKDNKILCWNPNSSNAEGEIVCEIPNSQQWIFEVNWCPRNPSLIVSSSCDGHTSIYSITGSPATQVQTNTKIADSFPGMGEAIPEPHMQTQQPVVDLKKAPKWLRRPVGATFGFGGKMVTFGSDGVKLLQVKGDESFLEQAQALGERLRTGNYSEICRGKEDPIWRYLEASFSSQPTFAIRALLGYNKESVSRSTKTSTPLQNHNVDPLTDQFSNLGQDSFDGRIDSLNHSNSELVNGVDTIFDRISAQSSPAKSAPFSIKLGNDVDSKVCKALLGGCIEEAINICVNEGKIADALILSITAGPDFLADTERKYFQKRGGYLSHILSALATEEWEPVAKNCDLSSWKEALSAMLTYCTDERLPDLCYELGKRLEDAGEEYSSCSEICYIASGNIAPLINKRLSGASASVQNIQEMVELVLVAQGAYSSRGQVFPIVGDVAKVLALYAELLSAEGDMDTALQYLNDSSDEAVGDLRERLYYALGHKTMPMAVYNQHYPTQQTHTVPGQRKTSSAYQNVVNSQALPPMNAFNKPGVGGQVQHLPPAPTILPAAQPSFPPARSTPAQPPPPTQAFQRSSPSPQIGGGITSKKYIVDPSVAGGVPGGFRSNSTLPYGQQQQQFQPSPGYQSFQPQGSSFPGSFPSQSPPVTPFQPPTSSAPFQPSSAASFQPPGSSTFQPSAFQPSAFQPLNSATLPGQTPFTPQQTAFNPQANQQFKPSVGPPPLAGQVLSAQNAAPSGWNDPPSFAPKNQPKLDPVIQTPITHPLYGTAPPQEFQPAPPTFGMPQQQYQPTSQTPNPFQPAVQTFQPPPSARTTGVNQGGYSDGPPPASARITEPPKPKAPIPQRYLHIQTTFEGLKGKCVAAAQNNSLMRRKLDDVAKKLEALYDSLREEKLSESTVGGLEELARYVEASDYMSGMNVITRLVAGSDFSNVASFMTGLKILLQTAQQLRVN